jgi:excinuclease ABC subunit C
MIKTIYKLKKIKISKTSFRNTPTNPGIYIFWKKDEVVYIGKAINLKNRLKSYLQINLNTKTKRMINSANSVSLIKVENELEALLLEAYLIKKFQPKYNIIAKDDKNPLYIKITKEKYPRIITARKVDEEKKDFISFFGPFPSSSIVKDVLRLLRRNFSYSDHKISNRACIYSQIGLCDPCPSAIEKEKNLDVKKELSRKYISKINIINQILKGNYKKIQNKLYQDIKKFSDKEDYESALLRKNDLKSLEYITQPIVRPKYFSDNPNLTEDIVNNQLENLSKIIFKFYKLKTYLKRIECYDISHISGTNTSASMVVFINGKEDKKEYRHFKIHTNKNNDILSLKEVAERRIKYFKKWGIPDLIIVDGGKSQTKLFNEIFLKYNIFVLGIAKKYETLVVPIKAESKFKYKEFLLPNNSAKQLILSIRNEAHRFAQRYHNILIKKNLIK